MSINNAVVRDLRQCTSGNLIETRDLVLLHCATTIHVVARPEAIQASPLFRKFYAGHRRFKATAGSKESLCKNGVVHLSINARIALRADDAFQRFMAPIRAAASTLS